MSVKPLTPISIWQIYSRKVKAKLACLYFVKHNNGKLCAFCFALQELIRLVEIDLYLVEKPNINDSIIYDVEFVVNEKENC